MERQFVRLKSVEYVSNMLIVLMIYKCNYYTIQGKYLHILLLVQ